MGHAKASCGKGEGGCNYCTQEEAHHKTQSSSVTDTGDAVCLMLVTLYPQICWQSVQNFTMQSLS